MIIENVLKNDIQSLNWYAHEVIIDAIEKYIPSMDSEGDFDICISGYEDGSREGGSRGLLFTIDKKLTVDEITDDGYDCIASIKSADITRSIIMFAEDTNGNENPYIESSFCITYNHNDICEDLKNLQNIFIEYRKNCDLDDPLFIKISLIVSIAFTRYNSFKDAVIRLFLDNL